MFTERTSVGLDVHARSVAAAAIDGVTGEVFKSRLVPDQQVVLDWLAGLPGPVATAYASMIHGGRPGRVLGSASGRSVSLEGDSVPGYG